MTVHINGSKGKDLYYGGTKIKEAYYNGNKVYSSVKPLYYCYTYYDAQNSWTAYEYYNQKPTSPGTYTMYRKDWVGSRASSSGELVYNYSANVTNATPTQINRDSAIYEYSKNDDLYT